MPPLWGPSGRSATQLTSHPSQGRYPQACDAGRSEIGLTQSLLALLPGQEPQHAICRLDTVGAKLPCDSRPLSVEKHVDDCLGTADRYE